MIDVEALRQRLGVVADSQERLAKLRATALAVIEQHRQRNALRQYLAQLSLRR